jgi:Ca-activated chloride channel family protein
MKGDEMIKRFLQIFAVAGMISFLSASSNTMIVFDASGSMWGRIDGKNKITIAKEVLRDVVKNWKGDTRLGLMVYGHRKKGDCNDIEVMVPTGRDTRATILRKVAAVSPKGKTPISRALRKAADALKFTEDKATVILISDGKETCDPDPCGTAKALKEQGIDFVTHVIGFNVDLQTDKQLSCIAKATGGIYFSAKNAKELADAVKSAAEKVEKPKPSPQGTVEVTAREEGGKPVKAKHLFFKEDERKENCISHIDEPCVWKSTPGKYRVESFYNAYKAINEIELKENETVKLEVVFKNTGKAIFSASETENGKPIEAYGYVYPLRDGELGKWVEQIRLYDVAEVTVVMPVGKYVWQANYNKYKKEIPFEVKPGETVEVHAVMGQTGVVEFSASEKEGGKHIRGYGWVYPVVDGEVGDENIGAAYPQKDEIEKLKLPVGEYVWKVRYNRFEKEVPFKVEAGKVTKVHAVMGQTGIARFSASDGSTGKWIDDRGWVYPVIDGEIGDENVGAAYPDKSEKTSLRLPVGRYVWKVVYGDFEKTVPFEIKAGENVDVHTVFYVTRIDTRCPDHENVHYAIYAANGRMVYEKDKKCGEPLNIALDKGTYTLESKWNDVLQKRQFEVGEDSRTVELVFEKTKADEKTSTKADNSFE